METSLIFKDDLVMIKKRISDIFRDKLVKKVLFITPPPVSKDIIDLEGCLKKRYSCFPPYSLLILSDILRKKGFEVSVLDLNYEILKFIQSSADISDYDTIWKYFLNKKIKEFNPDLIGITCMFTMTHTVFCQVCDEIARYDIPTVIGGVHVSNDAERVLHSIKNNRLIACTYESEVSFPNLLEYINSLNDIELTQLSMIIDGKFYSIKERQLPSKNEINFMPAFDLINADLYSSIGSIGSFVSILPKNAKISTVLSNKGCRAMCSFCSVRNFNGMGVRQRDVNFIVDEIEMLKKKYGINHIMWLDDDLFFNQERTISLFEEITRRSINITWDASNGVIAAACTPKLIKAAAESGCIGLYFGLESGNPEILLKVKKPGTLKNFYNAANILKDYPKIFTRGFLMIGFPHETLRQIKDTLDLGLNLGLDWYAINILQPLPSTPIYESMVNEGLIEDKLDTNLTRYTTGPYGKATQIERQEKEKAHQFINPFEGDLDRVPTRDELNDIWFYMNYKINFEPIKKLTNPIKLDLITKLLTDVADRVTTNHALTNLFLAICHSKCGNTKELLDRMRKTEQCLKESAYWRDKFENLGLYKDLEDLKSS